MMMTVVRSKYAKQKVSRPNARLNFFLTYFKIKT